VDRLHHLEHLAGLARRLVLNLLGVAVILDAVISTGTRTGELATGLILLGLVPIDVLVDRVTRRS
jgi:hypothetical protein